MVNAQEWLDGNYPKNQRDQITELDISNKNLSGSLKLKRFVNLGKLDCSSNELTNLDLSNCGNLKRLNCSDNQLTSLDFLNDLNPEKLTKLWISSNNFSKSDLTPFSSKFMNLDFLALSENNFTGSLKPLAGLAKLERLDISDTDINRGLEYLPDSVWNFVCLADIRTDAECQTLKNLLGSYEEDIQNWKKVNEEKIELFLAADKIEFIQKYFNPWNKYLSKQNELAQKQKWITYSNYARWTFAFGLTNAILAWKTNEKIIVDTTKSLALISGTIGAVNEVGKCWFGLERKAKELKNILKAKEVEFKQEAQILKTNYNELIKIWKDLSILSRNPTNSTEVNKSFNNFLTVIFDLEEQMKLLEEENAILEQPTNNGDYIAIDIFDEAEQEIKIDEELRKFAQELQTNWEKHKIDEIITNLINEIENYRQEIYRLEKPLPALPSGFNQMSSSVSNSRLASNDEEIELTTFAGGSVNNQEQQAQIIQKEPFGIPSSSKPK